MNLAPTGLQRASLLLVVSIVPVLLPVYSCGERAILLGKTLKEGVCYMQPVDIKSISASLPDTVGALRSGQRDLLDYVEEVCRLIDEDEPSLHALLPEPDRRSRLLQEAIALQRRYPTAESRPPLYGVLLGVKDIFVVDGFPTRAGSQLPAELFAGTEAGCVTKLRAAGALILGKTVTTEFAYFEPGPTCNPHDVRHTPGGSSSGSAAATAVGYCPLALGTQTIGSVIRPAAFCGVVGFKSSYGRIASDGLIACAPSLDTVGFFAQDSTGVAPVAAILCNDWRDNWHLKTMQRMPVLAIPHENYLSQASAEGRAAFEGHVTQLERAGYVVKQVAALPDIAAITLRHEQMLAAEMSRVHARWFSHYESLYRARTAELIRRGQGISGEVLEAARAGREQLRGELEGLMAQHEIDLWLSPAALGPAPAGLAATGSPAMNLPWTHAGLPAIGLPA